MSKTVCVCARALVNRASRIHCSLCEFISDLGEIPDWKYKPLNRSFREGEESGFTESDYATLIVSADGGEKKKMEENSKKGDSKGSSGRAEAGASSKEGTTSGANVGMKSKQDGGDGSKRLVSHRAKKRFSLWYSELDISHDSASDVLLLHTVSSGSLSLSVLSDKWISKMRNRSSHARSFYSLFLEN